MSDFIYKSLEWPYFTYQNEKKYFKRKYIDVNSSYIDEAIEFCDLNNIDFITISPYHGYKHDNIDFIQEIKGLRGIHVYNTKGIDLSAIERCPNMEDVTLLETDRGIDASKLYKLRSFNLDGKFKMNLPPSDSVKNLIILSLGKYREKTLEKIPHYENLMCFSVGLGSVISLFGLDRFKNLKLYSHYIGKNLADISAVTKLPQLDELRFDHCKKIEIDGVFEQCQSVKRLALISSCNIPSLSFLGKMENIEDFRFSNTDILDGDLTPLLQLKDFAFYPNKRNYSHTEEELKKIHAEMQ